MEDIQTKSTGDFLPPGEFNQIPDEMENVITSSGITLSGGDLTQLSKATANYAGSGASYSDSGSSTAYVLSPINTNVGPTAYVNGLVVNFIAGNTSTSTIPTVNVNTLGAKTIEKSGGGALVSGDIVAGYPTQLVFSTSADKFRLVEPRPATTTNVGVIELATNAEVQTGTDTIRAVTPASLASLSSNLVAASGHATMPGGLIIQWGDTGPTALPSPIAVAFDISFTTLFSITVTSKDESSNLSVGATDNETTSGFDLYHELGDTNAEFFYIALGI